MKMCIKVIFEDVHFHNSCSFKSELILNKIENTYRTTCDNVYFHIVVFLT
jgi:hypothetical protein